LRKTDKFLFIIVNTDYVPKKNQPKIWFCGEKYKKLNEGINNMDILDSLNEKQKEAVLHTDGPLLILAGAGSGKTTVLVNRIEYLIYEKQVPPYNILSITFTNKAANEMRERVMEAVGETAAAVNMGTFHSVCVRMLRRMIDKAGYDNNFVIYDSSDSLAVMKECLKEENVNDKNFPPRSVLHHISKAKDDMISCEKFDMIYSNDFRMGVISKLYTLYQKKLKNNNALDFDDIIYLTVKILSENPDILEKYQKRFKYIMVDEYQDTNNTQYKLISMLAGGYRNLCVVGDDDQSIYKFRGANIRNILDFEREFKDAVTIKLEQNYRSTKNILNSANSVIANNKGRKGKDLWTDNTDGSPITCHTVSSDYAEGEYIAKNISKLVKSGYKYSDCAILYRTNVQSRILEEMLMRSGIPYRILAGLRFYDRKEIKDIMAYLKVLYNPHDDVSLRRIINEPKRGIGDTTVEKARALAEASETSLFAVFSVVKDIPELSRAAAKIEIFMNIMRNIMMSACDLTLSQLVMRVLEDTGYLTMLKKEDTPEAKNRLDNLNEFMTVVAEHEENVENADLGTFIESVSLISDIDSYDEEQDAVALMTIHSAKGLEFPNVFLAGMEEGIFPSARSIDSEEDMEEERRLCYVAITRAKNNLYIINANSRNMYGKTTYCVPSRFIDEIPPSYKLITSSLAAKTQNILSDVGISAINTIKPINNAELKYKKGDRVVHHTFGHGIVVNSVAFGNDERVSINFEGIGMKHLMAAFAKLQKENEQQNENKIYKIGDCVVHPKFGQGIVQEAIPMGGDMKLRVNFEEVGLKNIMANYSNMKIIK